MKRLGQPFQVQESNMASSQGTMHGQHGYARENSGQKEVFANKRDVRKAWGKVWQAKPDKSVLNLNSLIEGYMLLVQFGKSVGQTDKLMIEKIDG